MKGNSNQYHVILFPFMSKGHVIPLLHFARLLLQRQIVVTVFTTSGNRSFLDKSLPPTSNLNVIEIPFSVNVAGIPAGTESTDQLPSMSLFFPFALATKNMKPYFESELEKLPPVNFMVSDGFLWWTLDSANKFGFPRLSFYGMSAYASTVLPAVMENGLLLGPKSDNDSITVPKFPWIRVTKSHFDQSLADPDTNDLVFEFNMLIGETTRNSYGLILNSFYNLESLFVDEYNTSHRGWCVGPLCLAEPIGREKIIKPTWVQWLDQNEIKGSYVLYVAFGSQAEISHEQLKEIAIGLEKSQVNFLWVIRKSEWKLEEEFEERVKERGIVVREWVDQREILQHPSVKGFLSHCGWNSVIETICAGVPIIAWPMLAEQPINAIMVEDEIKIGFKVETADGSIKGFVKWEGLNKMIIELFQGEKGEEVRKNVKELAKMAEMAMEEHKGSSWRTLDLLIQQIGDTSLVS